MAPQEKQDQALTIEEYRRLIRQIYQAILADTGTAGASPSVQETERNTE